MMGLILEMEDETEEWRKSVLGVFIVPSRDVTELRMSDEYLKKVKFEANKRKNIHLDKQKSEYIKIENRRM